MEGYDKFSGVSEAVAAPGTYTIASGVAAFIPTYGDYLGITANLINAGQCNSWIAIAK